jgi:hypothetical protein
MKVTSPEKKYHRPFLAVAKKLAAVLLLGLPLVATAGVITNDTFFKDTSGNPVYSQGGGIFKFGAKYYWYGVKYNGAVTYFNNPAGGKNSDTSFNAVTCYSSTDLINWTFENNILTTGTSGLGTVSWLGRLGVFFNAATSRYILCTQYSGSLGSGNLYCTSSTPNGNFAVNTLQTPVPGVANGTTGDQTVFTDTDGQSYLICSSSSGRSNWYVAAFNSNGIGSQTAVRIGGGTGREGNCMFKFNGRYYFCSSDLHGWNASHCYVISSPSIQGTYSSESVMAGTDADFCHVSQTGFFVTVAGSSATTVLFMGDRWADFAGNGVGYNQWCPLTFSGSTPTFKSVTKFNFDASTGVWSVAAGNNYVLNPSYEADRVAQTTVAGWTSTGSGFGNISGSHNPGRWHFHHSNTVAYTATTDQVITGLPNGAYTLKVWYESSGGQATARIFARNFGGSQINANVNTAHSAWTQVTISNIAVTNGQCDVGLESNASANQWVDIDDWELTASSGGSTADTYPAESAALAGGVTIDSNNNGFNGTGFANFPASGGTLTFNNVDGNGGGSKSLAIRYANGAATARAGNLTVNGVTTPISFATTGGWTNWVTMNVAITLNNNTSNTIQFASTGNDLGNIDEITVP